MSAPTSPPTLPLNNSKLMECKVLHLDDSVMTFHVSIKSVGQDLYNVVVLKLALLEADYFDLQYTDVQGMLCWLDHDKQVLRQISRHSLDFRFVVKFYSPDPGLLEEEYTRYLFALQVKRDLSTGVMPCQEHTAVLLASYIVQAELGDCSEADEVEVRAYLRSCQLLPKQNDALEQQIMEHHREHIGQNPQDAEFNLLDTARKVDLYGIQMHPAKDHETVALHLAVAHTGVLVFQNQTKINTFSWAKIRKLSFKRKKFLVKLHSEGYGYYKDTVEFYFESRNECKNFWKKCLEHHAFFRCHSVKRLPRNKTRVVSRGSSFRYSGRTQKQLIEHVRENFNRRPTFQRSTSMRTVSMSHSAMATPKTGTLRSRDFHLGHHLSLSTGSRIINQEQRVSTEEVLKVNGRDLHNGPRPSEGHSTQAFQLGNDNRMTAASSLFNATSVDMEGGEDSAAAAAATTKHRPSMDLRTGALDDFNCSYFKCYSDSNRKTGQTLDEREFHDNVSQDSYQLTESHDSLDFDQVRSGGQSCRDVYGAVDGRQLVKKLQKEVNAWGEKMEVDSTLDTLIDGSDEYPLPSQSDFAEELRMGRNVAEYSVESYSMDDAGERRRKRFSRGEAFRGIDDDDVPYLRGSKLLSEYSVERGDGEQNAEMSGSETPLWISASAGKGKDKQAEGLVSSCQVIKNQGFESYDVPELMQNSTVWNKREDGGAERVSCTEFASVNEDKTKVKRREDGVVCILRRRRLVSTGEQTTDLLTKEDFRYASLPLSFCRTQSWSPGRLATKEKQKEERGQIKTRLAADTPLGPVDRNRQASGFLTYDKLSSPKDSSSYKDDTLSPSSLEKETMPHKRLTHTKSSPTSVIRRYSELLSNTNERQRPHCVWESRAGIERPKTGIRGSPTEPLKLPNIDDILANVESESDTEEADAKLSDIGTPEMEDEVNRILSDIGRGSGGSSSPTASSIASEGRQPKRPLPVIADSRWLSVDEFLENIVLPPPSPPPSPPPPPPPPSLPLVDLVADFVFLLPDPYLGSDCRAVDVSEIPLPEEVDDSVREAIEGLLLTPPPEQQQQQQQQQAEDDDAGFDVSLLPLPVTCDDLIYNEIEELIPLDLMIPPAGDFGLVDDVDAAAICMIQSLTEELFQISLSRDRAWRQQSSEDSLLPPPPPWPESSDIGVEDLCELKLPEIIIQSFSDVELPVMFDTTSESAPGERWVGCNMQHHSSAGASRGVASWERSSRPVGDFCEELPFKVAPLVFDTTDSPPELVDNLKKVLQDREEKLLKKLSKDSGEMTSSSSRSLNDELDGQMHGHLSPVTDLPPAARSESDFLSDRNLTGSEYGKHGHVMEWLEEQALLNAPVLTSSSSLRCDISDEEEVEKSRLEHDLLDLYQNLEAEVWENPFLMRSPQHLHVPIHCATGSSSLGSSSSPRDFDSRFRHLAMNRDFVDPPLSNISSEESVVYPPQDELHHSHSLSAAAAAVDNPSSVPICTELRRRPPSPVLLPPPSEAEPECRLSVAKDDALVRVEEQNSDSLFLGNVVVIKDSSRSILLDLSSSSEDLPSEELPDVGDILDSNLLANPYAENSSDSDLGGGTLPLPPSVPLVRPGHEPESGKPSLPAPLQTFSTHEKEFDISSGSSSSKHHSPLDDLIEPDVFAALDEIEKPFSLLRPLDQDSDAELPEDGHDGDEADSESSSEAGLPHDDFVSCVLKHHDATRTDRAEGRRRKYHAKGCTYAENVISKSNLTAFIKETEDDSEVQVMSLDSRATQTGVLKSELELSSCVEEPGDSVNAVEPDKSLSLTELEESFEFVEMSHVLLDCPESADTQDLGVVPYSTEQDGRLVSVDMRLSGNEDDEAFGVCHASSDGMSLYGYSQEEETTIAALYADMYHHVGIGESEEGGGSSGCVQLEAPDVDSNEDGLTKQSSVV